MKKGFTKFWIEIIGGVIIVVVILLIMVYFGSAITTGVEDARNRQSFNDLTGAIAKAAMQGEETLAPFKLETSVNNRFYSIVFLGRDTVDCLIDTTSCAVGSPKPAVTLDGISRSAISKCSQTNLQASSTGSDMCVCLLRIDYACNEDGFNVISGTSGTTGLTDQAAVVSWSNNKLLEAFDKEGNGLSPIDRIVVVDCKLMIGNVGCYDTGTSYGEMNPCLLHYNGNTVFWMSGAGGILFDTPLYAEAVTIKKQPNSWYLDINFVNPSGSFYVNGESPCNCVRCI